MFKIIFKILSIVVLTLALVVIFISPIASKVIEKVGSNLLGVEVKVNSIDIGVLSGKNIISGLSVANPKGFSGKNAVYLGNAYLDVDVSSILSDKIIIKRFELDKPQISYEKGVGKANFNIIQENINNYMGTINNSENNIKREEQVADTKNSKDSAKKLQLDLFLVKNASAELRVNTPLGNKNIKINIPKIMIKDIGKENGGEEFSAVLNKIVAPFTKYINVNAVGSVKDKLENKFGKIKNKALRKIKSLF